MTHSVVSRRSDTYLCDTERSPVNKGVRTSHLLSVKNRFQMLKKHTHTRELTHWLQGNVPNLIKRIDSLHNESSIFPAIFRGRAFSRVHGNDSRVLHSTRSRAKLLDNPPARGGDTRCTGRSVRFPAGSKATQWPGSKNVRGRGPHCHSRDTQDTGAGCERPPTPTPGSRARISKAAAVQAEPHCSVQGTLELCRVPNLGTRGRITFFHSDQQ